MKRTGLSTPSSGPQPGHQGPDSPSRGSAQGRRGRRAPSLEGPRGRPQTHGSCSPSSLKRQNKTCPREVASGILPSPRGHSSTPHLTSQPAPTPGDPWGLQTGPPCHRRDGVPDHLCWLPRHPAQESGFPDQRTDGVLRPRLRGGGDRQGTP